MMMQETLRPEPSKDMSKRQRELLKESARARGENGQVEVPREFGVDELDEWVDYREAHGSSKEQF